VQKHTFSTNVIKQQGGLELLKKYYSMTMAQLFEDEEWQQDTAWSFSQAFDYLMDGVEKSGDEIVQHIKDLLNGCPTDVMIGNFGRWRTISFCTKIVRKHWIALYHMARSVADVEKNNSYFHTVATELIKLMSSKADNMQYTPTQYAALEWIFGFGEYMFEWQHGMVQKK
jgi:hypothetical protein